MPLLPLLALATLPALHGKLSCKGVNGKDVDWFMAYKLPSAVRDASGGRAFFYLDKSTPNWTLSPSTIDSPSSAIGATIVQLKEKSLLYAMYNDDVPNSNKTESYRGHTKGVIGFDGEQGFWIQHSMPNFPNPPTEDYGYPETAQKYGQTLICLTMKTRDLGEIGEQLRYMQISPYSFNIPPSFHTAFPVLNAVIAERESLNTRKEKVFTSRKAMSTAGGSSFTSFAKHRSFSADLIAVEEGIPLTVETWLNGAAKDLESTCSTTVTVLDIASINIKGNIFKSSRDHSKWGASDVAGRPLVCVGDINRQVTRGGGALCMENTAVWKSWESIIDSTSPCA